MLSRFFLESASARSNTFKLNVFPQGYSIDIQRWTEQGLEKAVMCLITQLSKSSCIEKALGNLSV